MKKINAIAGSIKWNGSVYSPTLIVSFTRTEDSNVWYEIHIKLTPDIARDVATSLKKYISVWWECQQNTLAEIQKHLRF